MITFETVVAIAKALGPEWKAEQDDMKWNYIVGPDDKKISITYNSWKNGRINISGTSKFGYVRDIHLPDISVSDAKTPEQIANDIKRRVLPDYDVALQALKEHHKKETNYKKGSIALRKQVAEVLGVTLRDENSEMIYGNGVFDVQVSGPESMRFTGHCQYLNLDQLKRIKEAVPELFEKKSY